MKRKYAIVSLLFLLFLPGCSRQENIGICLRDTSAGVSTQLMHKITDSLEKLDYQVTAVNASNDQAKQNGQIIRFLDEGCDLLIVEPVITAEMENVAAMAKEADVPVLFLNHEPDQDVLNSWQKLCYIGYDLNRPGVVMNNLAQSLPDGGDADGDGVVRYLVISGPEAHIDASVWAKTCGMFPSGQQLALEHGDWSEQSGQRIAGRCLGLYAEELDLIFCMGDEMALGAEEAIDDAERDIHLITVGGHWRTLGQVADGDISGVVCPDITSQTQRVAETVQSLLSDKTVEKRVLLDFISVTRENVHSY